MPSRPPSKPLPARFQSVPTNNNQQQQPFPNTNPSLNWSQSQSPISIPSQNMSMIDSPPMSPMSATMSLSSPRQKVTQLHTLEESRSANFSINLADASNVNINNNSYPSTNMNKEISVQSGISVTSSLPDHGAAIRDRFNGMNGVNVNDMLNSNLTLKNDPSLKQNQNHHPLQAPDHHLYSLMDEEDEKRIEEELIDIDNQQNIVINNALTQLKLTQESMKTAQNQINLLMTRLNELNHFILFPSNLQDKKQQIQYQSGMKQSYQTIKKQYNTVLRQYQKQIESALKNLNYKL